ncbi:hypothetical protein DF165_13955 [Burkholderia cenocepacia]|nr:hypothetical protein DF165_13955 [Burkholderia cenocepacia]
MREPIPYEDLGAELEIHFKCEGMGLREVGLICKELHRSANRAAQLLLGMPSEKFQADPLLISLELTNLEYGSVRAKAKALIMAAVVASPQFTATSLKEFGISYASNYVYGIEHAAPTGSAVSTKNAPPNITNQLTSPVDVGANLAHVAAVMAASGKPWELTVTDSHSGYSVSIKSGNSQSGKHRMGKRKK